MSLKKLVEEITKPVIDEMGIVAGDGTIKGGSRHSKIKKMKKKGHTSVPYGSGYKKAIKEMSNEKRAFLMLRIYGDSWKVNLGKVFSGINKQKPGMIKKGLKEIKILNKKIEDMIEDLV